MAKRIRKSKASSKASKTSISKTSRRTGRSEAPAIAALKIPETPKLRVRTLGLNKAPKAVGAKAPNTVIFVHGINNKPPASILKCQWDTALFGTRLGDRSRMVYWVNRAYYPTSLDETCASGDLISIGDDEVSTRTLLAFGRDGGGDDSKAIEREIMALADSPARQAWLRRIAGQIVAASEHPPAPVRTTSLQSKIIPLPEFLRRLIAQRLTRAFLRDVNDFLFVEERRKAMEQSLIDRIEAGGGPFVIVAHSQGTMIAYDVLRQLSRAQCEVPLFVTMGSPLGMQEVQDVLKKLAGTTGKLPVPACVDRWVNVADRLDPVAIDAGLSNDFEGTIEDVRVSNPDSPRHPHSATGYLKTEAVRTPVRETVGTAFQQSISRFAIAKDLVGDIEDSRREQRHSTLIQLSDDRAKGDQPRQLVDTRNAVSGRIEKIIRDSGEDTKNAEIDHLRHFISAKLTRFEIETLRSYFDDLKLAGIWRNAKKKALIAASTHTLQIKPANLGYGANGKDICWAVLDTGIRADHPHFDKFKNIRQQWDCTKRGDAAKLDPGSKEWNELDGNGHGTHVAGIIAGERAIGPIQYSGMAPRCSLLGFKVLNNNGEGDDAWIIKALDIVAKLNEDSGSLVVHGVNLSLGGNFDPEVFGCGHTPLCQELRRLWRQGVLVCLAAGNEGYAVLMGEDGQIPTNLDLSIGDPANLDEAIAVGSVHKSNPHTFGISYFSSRGPTADGRRKPDVVAPGEKIISARHDWTEGKKRNGFEERDLYVEMSGTSMATPHVSGLLASFLSLRKEFIGYPDRVKAMLLGGCVDLGRDPYMQGAGLPNLIKMLALN